ncbi:MAG: hypothetical protein RMJ98_12335 [Myxococcales bacterium]|nr:hypothetical protein [Polyangiaceae bacterium]MDW8250076.1 hypothetical protein [Myxococcales bacterium]
MNFHRHPFIRMHEGGAFSDILEDTLRQLPGCIAIVFVDQEGEAVDAVGWADEFDIKVAGAHLRLMLDLAHFSCGGETQDLIISASQIGYRVRVVAEGYALVFLFTRDLAFHASPRVLEASIYAICKEAGFSLPTKQSWFAAEVLTYEAPPYKPRRARGRGDWLDLQVLGALVGAGHQERGYRVRLSNGHEVTLLREPLGRWWSDAPLD